MSQHTGEFWIDVGGTITACFGRKPDGELLRAKVLSSGVVKGRCGPGSTRERIVAPAKLFVGYDFRLLDDRGQVVAEAKIATINNASPTDVAFTLAAALRHAPLVSHHHRQTGGHFLQKRAADVIADWCLAATTTR